MPGLCIKHSCMNRTIVSSGVKQDLIIKMALSSAGCPSSYFRELQAIFFYVGAHSFTVKSWESVGKPVLLVNYCQRL